MKWAASLFFAVLVIPIALALSTAARASISTPVFAAAETPVKLTDGPGIPYPEPLTPLPGKGLAQHDFLYTGEWDTRRPDATLFLVKGGKVVWTYPIPTKDESNGQLSEFSDMHLLSNGDIVFAYKTGWRKITKEGKTIYDYKCPKVVGPDGKE